MGNEKIISLEDMYKMLHIGKRKAKYMLDSGVIPCIDTGKRTHRYLIKKDDVLHFMESDAVFKYTNGMFSSENKATDIETNCIAIINSDFAREWYNRHFRNQKDILTLKEVRTMTGYAKETIRRWMIDADLRDVEYSNTIVIPKTFLIDWMSSQKYLSRVNKSAVQIEQMNAMVKEKQQA
jgi:hypothetical protein